MDFLPNEFILNSTSIKGKFNNILYTFRIKIYESLKKEETRILVTTDLLERGVDIEKINVVINYDIPIDTSSYLHRVGRAGRFGTKGLAITFISGDDEVKLLNDTQDRFEVKIAPLPDKIESITYMSS